jgi:hypothetical protein
MNALVFAVAPAVAQYPYLPAVLVAVAGAAATLVWCGPWGWDR